MSRLADDEAVMITADHGCDPTMPGTDHTRENVPLVVHGAPIPPINAGTVSGLGFAGTALAALLGVPVSDACVELAAKLAPGSTGGAWS